MLVLIKKENILYVKVLMDLSLVVRYQEKVFDKGVREGELLLPEEVDYLLTRNANIRLWNGDKYIKLNLGQFYEVMKNNDYRVEVEQPKPQPKVEEKVVKVETVIEPVKQQPKEEVKPEPKVEQPKEEKKQENKNYENKKQRHNNNNNKQQNQSQGGDK